jgi:hypothetical protein
MEIHFKTKPYAFSGLITYYLKLITLVYMDY